MKYVVTTRYHSSLCRKFGTGWLSRGQEIDLTPSQAAEFNVDYPGLLVPAGAVAPTPEPKAADVLAEPETRDIEAPPANRRIGRPPGRRNRTDG